MSSPVAAALHGLPGQGTPSRKGAMGTRTPGNDDGEMIASQLVIIHS
jgi:hypothetical protein